MNPTSRRNFLRTALLGCGGLALRSLATGLSSEFLTERVAHAEPSGTPTFLILATDQSGDPLNVGAPGSLADAGLRARYDAAHPAEVRSTKLSLGGGVYDAAAPWGALPPALLSRLGFVHHRTSAETHPEHPKVMRVFDAMRGATGNGVEMLPSAIAAELAASLGTIQREPMVLGEERVTYESRFVEQLSPMELKGLFGGAPGALSGFAKLRDKTLDAVYADVKASGTKAQRAYLDRTVASRAQAAELGDKLAVDLGVIPVTDPKAVSGLVDDYPLDAIDQVLTAVTLVKYKVSPVVTIHLPFGGDNHHDVDFAQESLELQGGVRIMQLVWEKLAEAGLEGVTTFAMLNTFGRTLDTSGGRAHNSGHHVMPMFGPKIRAGVAGAPQRGARDWEAAAFSSTTGRADGSGDVTSEKSFAAAARTLMRACGVPAERVDVRLPGATVTSLLV